MDEWVALLQERLGDWPFRGPEPYDLTEATEADDRRQPGKNTGP